MSEKVITTPSIRSSSDRYGKRIGFLPGGASRNPGTQDRVRLAFRQKPGNMTEKLFQSLEPPRRRPDSHN